MKDNLLEVGDVIYTSDWRYGLVLRQIKKVEIGNGRDGVSIVGSYGSADIETPELKLQWQKEQNKIKLKNLLHAIKVKELSDDQVKQLIEILKPC